MKFKYVLWVVSFFFSINVFSNNYHIHPQENNQFDKQARWPDYCEIEIVNDSSHNLRVNGVFDDGYSIMFNIYRFEYPHYISLYYYGYCHYGMNIYIDTFNGYRVFNDYVPGGHTIYVRDYLKNGITAQVKKK